MIYGPHKAKRLTWDQFRMYWTLKFLDLFGLRKCDHWSTFSCPHCSEISMDDERTLLWRGPSRPHTSMECMGPVHDWEEQHQCDNCGTVYNFTNSDY